MQPRDFFSYGLKNEFETAVVNEPAVFEPLKFYCKMIRSLCFATAGIIYLMKLGDACANLTPEVVK